MLYRILKGETERETWGAPSLKVSSFQIWSRAEIGSNISLLQNTGVVQFGLRTLYLHYQGPVPDPATVPYTLWYARTVL